VRPELEREPRSFSLTEGGPFHHVLTRLRLRTPTSMKRCWWLAFFVWLPLVIGEGVRIVFGLPIDPTLSDLSSHVRLLFTLPVLLLSERLLDQTAGSAMASFYSGNFCDRARIDRIADRAERLRDAWVVEAALLGLAVVGGQLVLWEVFGSTGWIHGGARAGFWSFPRVWYAVVALPIFQFVMFRWLWRWLIWSYMLARLSRLPLSVLATHPDYAGGLAALARPMTGFGGFVLGMGAVLAGAWATQVLEDRTTLPALLPGLVAFLVLALAIAVGPLLLFSGHLFRARRRTLAQYGDFARRYMLRFHDKWIARPTEPEQPLGSPDIQSLNDLGEAFQVISKTRVFVFGPRNVLVIWFAGILPMVPLFASALTVEQVLKRIVSTVLGGVPF
jgi:hypothetical protein